MCAFIHLDLTRDAFHVKLAEVGGGLRLTVYGRHPGDSTVTIDLPSDVVIVDRRVVKAVDGA